MRLCIEMNKTVIKFDDIETEKQKFHQDKRPISIKDVDISKTVASNKASLGKKGFEYFIGNKDAKKLDFYTNFFQKLVHVKETLMKEICIFW